MKDKPNIEDHPFPNEELNLLLDWNKELPIPIEQIAVFSNLIHKYLELRAEIFHEIED